jgi:cobalt ECF transporter T component CbiQ
MKDQIPLFLLSPELRSLPSKDEKARQRLPFIDRTLRKVAGFIRTGYLQIETASNKGLLQRLDARIKLLFMVCFIIQANVVRQIPVQLVISAFLLVLYLLSRLNIFSIYKKILFFSFFFGFLVFAPAALNVITDGKIIIHLFHFQDVNRFWVYRIPAEIGITREGILVVARLYLKVVNSLTITFLVFNTTQFNEIVKALKIFKVPDMFLLIITMTYKFIFILVHTMQETYFALKLRWWKKVKNSEANRIIAGRIVYTFRKSWHRYEEVFRAMLARGFTGEVNIYYLRKITNGDIYFLVLFLAISLGIYLI